MEMTVQKEISLFIYHHTEEEESLLRHLLDFLLMQFETHCSSGKPK